MNPKTEKPKHTLRYQLAPCLHCEESLYQHSPGDACCPGHNSDGSPRDTTYSPRLTEFEQWEQCWCGCPRFEHSNTGHCPSAHGYFQHSTFTPEKIEMPESAEHARMAEIKFEKLKAHYDAESARFARAAGIGIREVREKAGVSLRSLAQSIQVSAAFQSDFELGRRGIPKGHVAKCLAAIKLAEGEE